MEEGVVDVISGERKQRWAFHQTVTRSVSPSLFLSVFSANPLRQPIGVKNVISTSQAGAIKLAPGYKMETILFFSKQITCLVDSILGLSYYPK